MAAAALCRWRFDDDGKLSLFIDGLLAAHGRLPLGARVHAARRREFGDLLAGAIKPTTVYMSHPRVEFASNKGVLPLLCDARFLKTELHVAEPTNVMRYVTPSRSLADAGFPRRRDWKGLVVKHNFGSGGEGVFVGEAIAGAAAKIGDPAGWIVQDRHELNQMYARLLSPAIARCAWISVSSSTTIFTTASCNICASPASSPAARTAHW